MDETDILLVKALAKDADVTATELTVSVNLSVPAINKRIARLKSEGTIRRVAAITDPKRVGKPVVAFVLLVLDRFSDAESLLEQINADPDILECYAVTGEYDYLIKICATDIASFENKLLKLKAKSVAKSHTMLTLCEHKFEPSVLPD